MVTIRQGKNRPGYWVPGLYFFEGLPYVLVNTVAVNVFWSLGLTQTQVALLTSILLWPWVVKPLWAPLVDVWGSKRQWVKYTQSGMLIVLIGLILSLSLPNPIVAWLGLLGVLALLSATHDIAADGFYIVNLTDVQQSFFSGIRNTFYRLAMIAGSGGLVMLAGLFAGHEQAVTAGSWQLAFAAVLVVLLLIYGLEFGVGTLPDKGTSAARPARTTAWYKDFAAGFKTFFAARQVWRVLGFILLYRIGEALLGKIAPIFLLDTHGGLGLSMTAQGFLSGTVGVAALLSGGILGGLLVVRFGLKNLLWPLALALNVPDLVYVYLSMALPKSLWTVGGLLAVEQFGYGLGFSSFTMVMLYFAGKSGRHQTGHYALLTGFMALGMMLPGSVAGKIYELSKPHDGAYDRYFLLVMLATVLSFAGVYLVYKIIPNEFCCRHKD